MEWGYLEPGSVILMAEPFAHAVDENLMNTVCDACFRSPATDDLCCGSRPRPLMTCGGCKCVRYCNRNCQKVAWPEHKAECKYLAKHLPVHFVRLLFKIWVKLQNGGKTVSCHLPDGKTLTFFELPSLPCDINDDPVQSFRLTYIHFELNEFVGHKAPSRDEILPIFSILARNKVTIKDDSECPRGSAIYLEASEFEHSCQGNATFDFNGKYLLARYVGPNSLKRPVKISRDLKVSRSALLWDTPTRQQFLRDQFSISCNCGKCRQDPLEVDHFKQGCLKCPECDGPVPVPKTSKQKSTKQIRCPNCQRNVSAEALETFWILKPKLRKIYENGVVSFDIQGSLMIADDWRITLEADRSMHYYDQDYLNCLLIGTKFAMLNDSYGIALDMCLKVVQALDFYLSIPSFLAAKVHYNICLAANALKKYALLRKHVEKAMNLVAITRGREHHLNSKLALFEVVSRFGSCDDFSDTD